MRVPGLEDLLTGASLMNVEFKYDLIDFLAQVPSAPVKSLGEILDRGGYQLAFETNFKAKERVESRDTEERRRALIKQAATRQALLASIEENRLDALVYPTGRRKAA